jgi:ATP-dependent helicase HrpB
MSPLPLDSAWPEIEHALREHLHLVLVAEPGAGKTTRFPPLLLASDLLPKEKKVLVLEPRRLAARASALRIAHEQGWQVGGEVGYQVRFDNKTSPRTRLQFLTEGLLAKRLQNDPELSDVGAVVLDEFHERSQHTDLALGLLFELQQLARPDLRIVVMSATLDAERVSTYLGDAPVVKVKGRTYPVDVHHSARPMGLETGPAFLDRVAEMTLNVIEGVHPREGDVLVFLPGAREIRGVRERIATRAERAGFDCLELHGSLPLEQQDRAIRRDSNRSKIVLSTNIAETSLTIDGVGTVIDSGLARVSHVDALGFTRLSLSRISLASATQRAGRAGRQGPGHAYRLWSKFDESSMIEFDIPEILRTDLTDPLLALLSQGVTDAYGFSWFERPNGTALKAAQKTLSDLGFRDAKSGELTNDGREALKLPLAARLARLVLESARVGRIELGAQLAALLSEKDIVMRLSDLKAAATIQSDLVLRLHLLNREGGDRVQVDRMAMANVKRVASAIESAAARVRVAPSKFKKLSTLDADELALRLILLAFPDRVCKRRKPKEAAARMVGAKGVWLSAFSAVETEDLFVALDAAEPPAHLVTGAKRDAQITVASYVERAWIEEFFPQSIGKKADFTFDSETLAVQKQTAVSFQDLPLENAHPSRPTADEAFPILIEAAKELWSVHFLKPEALGGLFDRLRFLREQFALDFDVAEVEAKFLEEACYHETRLSDVLAKPLEEIFLRHLPPTTSQLLEKEAPDRISVPSGSHIRVQYPEARAPFIEVRIQELFGMTSTPKLAKNRVPLTVHLLGPNYRPVQVTNDLESFWKNGYVEVRKELRLRYPKHSWPEDPYTARPEAKGRRRE